MSSSLSNTLLPQCSACARRMSRMGLNEWHSAGQQVRGKKKLANTPNIVTVRLRKDVATFGRAGAFVPISAGRMRNSWFPTSTADYLTLPQLKELRVKNIAMERDFQFGLSSAAKAAVKPTGPEDTRAQLEREAQMAHAAAAKAAKQLEAELRISPERSVQLLTILLPPRLQFYRQAMQQTPVEQELEPEPETASAGAPRARAPAPLAPAVTSGPRAIFGSVSSADVAVAMKAVLAENDEAARVVFGEEDVRFVNVKDEEGRPVGDTDRVKHLGEFNVEIRVRGAEIAVKRVVRVLAEEP